MKPYIVRVTIEVRVVADNPGAATTAVTQPLRKAAATSASLTLRNAEWTAVAYEEGSVTTLDT